jgi:tetratricopeptide (TPR) repeat protein/tRNA A-37 threonylcarbamoyl transferase component Bud32
MSHSSVGWNRLEALFYQCLELTPEARSAFLDEHCGADSELRREVEALLDEADKPMDLLEQPIFKAAQDVVGKSNGDVLKAGTRIGHYEIVSLVAIGGMAQVYLALDTSLKRQVAFKVLLPEFTHEVRRMGRFKREAQAASALSHPNIVTIYEFGQIDGTCFMASEFVDGPTLRQQLSRGRLDLSTTLNLGIQIVGALAAAHALKIVHRDVKPENIMVRTDGIVKVLDFGIAKPVPAPGVHRTQIDTATSITEQGVLIGTVAYMSPEQAAGKELDIRSDLFSFGAVVYEMTAGVTPFPGETATAVLESILTRPPMPLRQLNPEVPAKLERIILKSLEKDPNARYQHAFEIRSDLESLQRETDAHHATAVAALAAAPGTSRRRWYAAAAFVLALAVCVGYVGTRGTAKLTDKDTVVLADFSNATNDPVFDDTLRQGLSAQLEQSPFLNLLSDKHIAETLLLMAQPKDTKLTGQVVREVCQRTASAATIEGSVVTLGRQYVLGLKAVNCRTGDLLAEEQATASGKEQVLDALGKAAAKLRARLGESLASVEKYDEPPQNVTTISLEALQAYGLALKALQITQDAALGIQLYQRAISLDPEFAMAYARLGTAYYNVGETERAAENTRKAYELRGTVSEREKFYIDSHYEMVVSGDLEEARKTYELWMATFPRDEIPHFNLGVIYAALGDYAKALAGRQEALSLHPADRDSYVNLANAYANLNRLDDARATAQKAQNLHLDPPSLHQALYFLDFLQHDADGIQREAGAQMKGPGMEAGVLYQESDTAAYGGQLAKARELTRRATDSAHHAGDNETAADYETESAVREALVGNSEVATRQARAALLLAKGRDAAALSAMALALAGESAEATRLADDLARRFPEGTIVQVNYLPTIRAAAAIHEGNPAGAIQALARAATYELGVPDVPSVNFNLYPVYLRGLAYLGVHQGSAAAAEFQKIIDHSGIVVDEPIGALAHLQMGRAYAMSGDMIRARTVYQDFLTLWKDADADVPIFKQAKTESAKLM